MTTSDKPLEFDHIYQHGAAFKTFGKLKLVKGGLGWKENSTTNITTVKSEDFEKLFWSRCARDYQITIFTKKNQVFKFDGFPRDAFDILNHFVAENYEMIIAVKEFNVKGWNWGKCQVQDQHLGFMIQDKPAFEIPMQELSNAAVSSKNEVIVEFNQAQSGNEPLNLSAKKMDCLVDIRFYIPPQKPDEDQDLPDDDEEANDDEVDAATAFCNLLKSSTDLGGLGTAERIVTFSQVPFAVPRGRYDADLYFNLIRLRGKSYDYKIPYSSIVKLFLLPRPDDLHVVMVMALDPPLRQGQTRYPFLVIQFVRDEEMTVELSSVSSDLVKSHFGDKLKSTYDGPFYESFTTILKIVTDKKVIVPGSFKSAHQVSCVKCSMKANEGHLYFLEKSFLFLQKPVIYIPHDDLVSVTFSRVDNAAANSRTFDATFTCRGSVDYSFSNFNKEELPYMESFLRDKKIQFQNEVSAAPFKKSFQEEEDEELSDASSINKESAAEDESSTDEDYQEGDDETGSDESSGSNDEDDDEADVEDD